MNPSNKWEKKSNKGELLSVVNLHEQPYRKQREERGIPVRDSNIYAKGVPTSPHPVLRQNSVQHLLE